MHMQLERFSYRHVRCFGVRISTSTIVKSKAVPLRHAGAKRERNYSSYSFWTSALDRVSSQRHAPAALYPWDMHCPMLYEQQETISMRSNARE
jgi:hypothetical protein